MLRLFFFVFFFFQFVMLSVIISFMFGLDGEWIDKKFKLEYLSLMFNKIFRGDQIISFRVSHNCQNQESK